MEEVEQIQYEEEEEYTAIYRKTKRTKSTRRKKTRGDTCSTPVKTEIQLNPFIHGARGREMHKPGLDEGPLKGDFVQKLVKDTLNQYKGSAQRPNRFFLGQCDSEEEDVDEVGGVADDDRGHVSNSYTVWRCRKTGRKGFDRFRKVVEFVILAQQAFTVRRSVHLNRRDSILFFMDTGAGNHADDGDSKPKFDVNAFKGIAQKTKTASIKSCLDVPPCERTDAQVNQMVHLMKHFQKFSNYPQAVQTGICKQGWYAKFESTKVMVKEGNRADFYYLILSGLAVYRDTDTPVDGTSSIPVTSLLRPGDTLGEKEILTNLERPATVVCKEDVEVLGVDRDTLISIFEASGGIGSIEYLKNLPEFQDFPLELLQTYHFSMSVHYYRRGTVIVKNSRESEWVYIVRSGSCQVYKTVTDSSKPKDTVQRKHSTTKRGSKESGEKLVLPDISRSKRDTLRSASTDNIRDILEKKNKTLGPERSQTMLPSLVPGKTSLVNQRPSSRLSNTPTLPQINKHKDAASKKKKKKTSSDSPKASRKKYSATPDLQRLSKTTNSHSETPDSAMNSPRGNLYSPSVESVTRLSVKKGRKGSDDSMKRRYGVNGEKETSAQKAKYPDENGTPIEADGHVAYVRLDVVLENGVFGFHPLVYENTPSLSLVSNGAECVLVSKKFLKDHMTDDITSKLKKLLTPYPGPDQLRHALDDVANWETYRGRVVDDVVLS